MATSGVNDSLLIQNKIDSNQNCRAHCLFETETFNPVNTPEPLFFFFLHIQDAVLPSCKSVTQ